MPHDIAPALLIGLGGSGTEIVRRFKRRFLSTYGPTPYIGFLCIDTAPQTASTKELPQLPDAEFIHAANFNSEFFVGPSYIDQNPAIRSWWQAYTLPTRMIQQGAGMRRPFGRLAFYVHFASIKQRLTNHLYNIFNNEVVGGLPANYRKVINVYIASSTCGGTGTGMYLDMAYLTTALVPQIMPTVTPYVRAIMLLPSAFVGTNNMDPTSVSGLQANAYGALAELDVCMNSQLSLEPIVYPDGSPVPRRDRPFQTCFLLGNQTADGALVTNMSHLLEHAAIQLQIDLASPLDQDGKSRMDNILTDLGVLPPARGKPRLYSSFHNAWIELPSKRILARWERALATRFLERLSGSGGTTAELESAAAYKRVANLVSGQGLGSFLPQVQPEVDHFMDIPAAGADPGALIGRAQALQTAAARQIEQNRALLALVSDCLSKVIPEVRESSERMLPSSSLFAIRQLVGEASQEMERWLDSARAVTRHADSSPWLNAYADKITGLKKGLLGSSDSFAQRQREVTIDALEAARDAWKQALRAKIAGPILDQVPALAAELRRFGDRVDQARAALGTALSTLSDSDPTISAAVHEGAVPDGAIDEAFANPARLERLELALAPEVKGVLDTPDVSAARLADRVLAAAHVAVKTVAPEYLGTLDIPAPAIAATLTRLSPLAVFEQSFSATPESSQVRKLWLVGLPESSREKEQVIRLHLPADINGITQFVYHGDEERVVLTVQHHGFPLYSLAEVDKCSQAYKNSPDAERGLRFVLPDAQVRSHDLLPLDPGTSKMWFAVAIAAGYVTRAGTAYRFKADSFDVELASHGNPADARRAARDAFILQGLAAVIQRLCDMRVRREGNEPLYSALNQWVQEQEPRALTADYPREFQADLEQVKNYMVQIKPH